MERVEVTNRFQAQAVSENRSAITQSANDFGLGARPLRASDRACMAFFTLACFAGLTALFVSLLSFVPGTSALALSRITMALLIFTFAFMALAAHAMDKADAIRRGQKVKKYLEEKAVQIRRD